MRDYSEILADLDCWATIQPEAAEAIRTLLDRVDELEGDAERCKHGIRLPHECGECQNSVDTEAAVAWYAYESVAAILEPHMGRNGRDGILPASVTDAVQILLEHRLRHPPTERAVPEWRSCTDDPPPFDIPVFVRWKKWPDKMVSAIRVDDSDGWFWAQHVGGYHADFLDPESYEFDDDYAYDEWHPMPMTALWPAAPGAGGGE